MGRNGDGAARVYDLARNTGLRNISGVFDVKVLNRKGGADDLDFDYEEVASQINTLKVPFLVCQKNASMGKVVSKTW